MILVPIVTIHSYFILKNILDSNIYIWEITWFLSITLREDLKMQL